MSTPLTLLETIDAIRRLPTEKDILENACTHILFPQDKTNTTDTAITNIFRALDGLEMADHFIVLLQVLIGSAIHSCRPGKETELLKHLRNSLTEIFQDMLKHSIETWSETDPARATAAMEGLISAAKANLLRRAQPKD